MKARALISSASYGPEALKTVCQAFDEAWADVAANFGNEADQIKRSSFQIMALQYRAQLVSSD